ncbi:unnamed protein product [Acanthoscelides obtectus]|uniref:Uncharacterized protein n=1 Tax=Acanthoscelides obtectus TaxID=200917 RepID=A0A9P0NT78_ACAOB|nr:unnamed protein product [Acanthoscelides obtectus]CAK1655072.1 hypothetical protein AOBTE_LOCUS19008 [Acanthoscelides obtectus]
MLLEYTESVGNIVPNLLEKVSGTTRRKKMDEEEQQEDKDESYLFKNNENIMV